MKKMLRVLLALTASAVMWAGQASATLIEIGTPTVDGTGVTIEVFASDLNGDIISAYDMDILFDDSVLNAAWVSFTYALGDASVPEVLLGAGVFGNILDVWAVSLLSDAALDAIQNDDPLLLFTAHFDWDEAEAAFDDFGFIWDEFNDVKCAENQVCYPSVPEPGTLSLLGLGLLGLGLARRRRRA